MALKAKQASALLVRRSSVNLRRVWNDPDTMKNVLADPDARREFGQCLYECKDEEVSIQMLQRPLIAKTFARGGMSYGAIATTVSSGAAVYAMGHPETFALPGVFKGALKWPKARTRLLASPEHIAKLSLDHLDVLREKGPDMLPGILAAVLTVPDLGAVSGLTGEPLAHTAARTDPVLAGALARDAAMLDIADARGVTLREVMGGLYPSLELARAGAKSVAAPQAAPAVMPDSTPEIRARVAGVLTRYDQLVALTPPQRALVRRELDAVLPVVAEQLLADPVLAGYTGLTGRPMVHELVTRYREVADYVEAHMPHLLGLTCSDGETTAQCIQNTWHPVELMDLEIPDAAPAPASPAPAEARLPAFDRVFTLLDEADRAVAEAPMPVFTAPAISAPQPVRRSA